MNIHLARSSLSRIGTTRLHAICRSRDLSTPPPPPSLTEYTISRTICKDHCKLEAYTDKMLGTSTGSGSGSGSDAEEMDTRERYQNQYSWLLAKHAAGEELVLYPAYEQYLGGYGREAADRGRQRYEGIKAALEYFQRLYPRSAEFEPKLRQLARVVAEHASTAERCELPLLERAMSACVGTDASVELACSFRRTQWFVPTRAHPWMPNRPPFDSVVAFLGAPVDQLRDMFRKFPDAGDLEATEVEYRQKLMRQKGGGRS